MNSTHTDVHGGVGGTRWDEKSVKSFNSTNSGVRALQIR